MKRLPLGLGIIALVCVASGAAAQAPAASSWLPSLPSDGSSSQSSPYEEPAAAPARDAASSKQKSGQELYEHIVRSVVALERNGAPVAIGTVLSGDGRVLTALSGLAGGDGADVRYADGTVVHAKVGRSDRTSDLALLIPQAKRSEGLTASEVDPAGQELRAMVPAHGTHLGPAVADVKGQVDAHSREGSTPLRMLDVDVKGPSVIGAPLLDSSGGVVGVLVRACKPSVAEPTPPPDDKVGSWYPASAQAAHPVCSPVVLGAPVSAIRSFLAHVPATPSPWLGIRGEPELSGGIHGVRVEAVAPSSPAEKAALKPTADLIVAVDGHPLDTPEKLAEIIAKHAPGDTVKLLVFSGDLFRDVTVGLRSAP